MSSIGPSDTGARTLASSLALGLAMLLPGAGLTEGAVKVLDCTVMQVCDAEGTCEAGSGHLTFRMEPLDLKAGGPARYALSYGDTKAAMEAMSEAGPFFWAFGNERDTLLASSETQWLWHRLTLGAVPEAAIRFLACEFQQ
jgi:hypothetical protein